MGRNALKSFDFEHRKLRVSTYTDGSIEISGADDNGEFSMTSEEAVDIGTYLINQAWPHTNSRRNT